MSKTVSNVLKFVLSEMEIVDAGSMDGYSCPLTVTAHDTDTITVNGVTVSIHAAEGRDILLLTGTGAPQIRTISHNTGDADPVLTVSTAWLTHPDTDTTAELSPELTTHQHLGFMDEAPAKLTLTPILDREAGGSEITRAYEGKLETSWMEVLSLDSTFQGKFQNKKCWLKATGITTGQSVWFKNFMMNIAVDLDLAAKGKSRVKLTGTGIFLNISDAVVIGMS